MPRKRPAENQDSTCNCLHSIIWAAQSPIAGVVGFRPKTKKQLGSAAAFPSLNRSDTLDSDIGCFPFPLLLPDDDLALDPTHPAQPVHEWLKDEDRNKVTPMRRTIYVAAPPTTHSHLTNFSAAPIAAASTQVDAPSAALLTEYLAAFYHGMPVRALPVQMEFRTWDEKPINVKARSRTKRSSAAGSSWIGLAAGTTLTRIRTRPAPDGMFKRQLNSDDMLDAVLAALPDDAYAVVMLVHHDLWEGEEDEESHFICGRAYGASRIAIVSSARYNPALDEAQNLNDAHGWPASHCAAFVHSSCEGTASKRKKRKEPSPEPPTGTKSDALLETSPMRAAINAYVTAMNDEPSPASTWLARVARTAAHELGHCFGLDHCVYFACSMQGTAGIAEDARQPPYLCPICVRKLSWATGFEGHNDPTLFAAVPSHPGATRPRRNVAKPSVSKGGQGFKQPDEAVLLVHIRDRYVALRQFCAAQSNGPLFVAHAAWLDSVL
ncbi:hypothetical protein BKA62DRAFT_688798 [Auriculariales sp. MPI-PUGE-AT-0066]|nr:hypothetical protein BKA62DRAFT_688798 [Auriculariales sp. MPI-PUGE-AT-0066]